LEEGGRKSLELEKDERISKNRPELSHKAKFIILISLLKWWDGEREIASSVTMRVGFTLYDAFF